MPINQDGSGRIIYTEPDRNSVETGTGRDDEFAIVDKFNELKQIRFNINPTTPGKGFLTLTADIAGDQTVDILGIGEKSNSFEVMQTPFGTSPTAETYNDTLTWTSSDGSIKITGDSSTDTIDLTLTSLPEAFALTDAPTITTDASVGKDPLFYVTLGGNRLLAAPTNPQNGQKIIYRIRQDATGGRTLTLDPIFRFGEDVPLLVLSVNPNTTDYFGCIYNSIDNAWDVVAISRGH